MSVVEGGAKGVMCSYNSINGVPTCASPLLTKVLRDTWGFEGYNTADSDAVSDIGPGSHHYTATAEEAVAAAMNDGGCDLDSGAYYYRNVMSAVSQGLLTRATVNRALHRTIKLRFQLGTVRVFRQKVILDDAIGSHACSLEANMRLTNGIPLGSPFLLPVGTVNCVQTLKVCLIRLKTNRIGTVRVFDRNLHLRMPLVPTPARLKRASV
jgi:hypothetical protein